MLICNLDCQGSFGGGIIVQVLGELSNEGGPAQKFVQTFFLAEQPQGYYVLNDLFRYLKEDPEDEEDEDEIAVVEQENGHDSAHPVIASQDMHDQEALIVEGKQPAAGHVIIEVDTAATDLTAATEETVTRTQVQESQPITIPAQTTGESKKAGEKKTEKKVEKKTADKKTEKKKENKTEESRQEKSELVATDSTVSAPEEVAGTEPVAASPAPTPAPAPAAPQPAKVKSWATLAANNPTQWGPQVATAKAGVVTAPIPAPTAAAASKPQHPTTTTASTTHHQSSQNPRPHRPNGYREEYHSIYIKNVTERMSLDQLRQAFSKFGVVTHLELTQKKNCAFLDFSTTESMNAALKQNLVPVGNEMVLAEERRRNSNNNFNNYNSNANGGGPRGFNHHQGAGPQSQGHNNGLRGGGAGGSAGGRINNNNVRGGGGGPSDRKPAQNNNNSNNNKVEKASPGVATK